MITLTKIIQADIYRILKNKALCITLIIPQLLVLGLCLVQLNNTLDYRTSGYDMWILFSKDILLILTFVFPLLSIIYPFVVFENEHRYNALRTHTILPLKMGSYFFSKVIIICLLIVFVIFTASLVLLILGYTIGGIYKIKEFVLYTPVFIIYYTIAMLLACMFLAIIHVVLNIFFKSILINTVPFLLLLFISFFLTDWRYNYLIPHSYPFVVLSNLQFNEGIFLDFPVVNSVIGLLLILLFLYLTLPRLQYLWIK